MLSLAAAHGPEPVLDGSAGGSCFWHLVVLVPGSWCAAGCSGASHRRRPEELRSRCVQAEAGRHQRQGAEERQKLAGEVDTLRRQLRDRGGSEGEPSPASESPSKAAAAAPAAAGAAAAAEEVELRALQLQRQLATAEAAVAAAAADADAARADAAAARADAATAKAAEAAEADLAQPSTPGRSPACFRLHSTQRLRQIQLPCQAPSTAAPQWNARNAEKSSSACLALMAEQWVGSVQAGRSGRSGGRRSCRLA